MSKKKSKPPESKMPKMIDGHPVKMGKWDREHVFTNEEVARMALEAAALNDDHDDLVENAKDSAAAYRDRIKSTKKAMDKRLNAIRDKVEMRSTSCLCEYDAEAGRVYYRDKDTQEIVDVREFTPDTQKEIPGTEACFSPEFLEWVEESLTSIPAISAGGLASRFDIDAGTAIELMKLLFLRKVLEENKDGERHQVLVFEQCQQELVVLTEDERPEAVEVKEDPFKNLRSQTVEVGE